MGCVRILADGANDPLAADAAYWLAQFYSDLDVSWVGRKLVLRADARSESELGVLWRTALANERLHHAGRSYRSAALAALA
jgi:hypothetical protein